MKDEVLNCIKSRRSIRKFKEKQIDASQLDALLEAATWAPSGGNNQSWLFVAVQNREMLARINERLRRSFLAWTPDDDYPAKRKAVINAQNENVSYLHHASTLIIAANIPDYQNAMADCSAALQNIFLAAAAMGLGSCWINQPRWLTNDAPLRDLLVEVGLPRERVICGSAAVGYPDHAPPAPKRREGTVVIYR
ncbi:MAG: nitroreductase [Desulfovibrio sp.]|jgi:nitroreductase|nr:nitroreductase [Desulfovibrio sp.]